MKSYLIWPFSSLIAVGLIVGGLFLMSESFKSHKPLRMALGGPWLSLHPGLQHTMWADVVLSNQFEALIGTDKKANSSPLGARSWTISDDMKTYVFYIDTSKRFSDGSHLSANDFKESWERSLELDPKSANNSLLDLLYLIDGFDDFQKHKAIAGIEVTGDDKLTLHLKRPSRMILHHLTGNRFAAYKMTSSGPIGTGRYVIHELSSNLLDLTPNQYYEGYDKISPIRLTSILTENIAEPLEKDLIDGLAYGRGANLPQSILNDEKYEVLPGPEANHHVVQVNGSPGRVFSNEKLRLALQYLVLTALKKRKNALGDKRLVLDDSQIFLALQVGRIDDTEANKIIDEGKKYISELRIVTQKHPLIINYMKPWEWVADDLKEYGIAISDKSGPVEYPELIKLLYKGQSYDLLVSAFSVVASDPDGIYHALGKNGAILCPVAYRSETGKLLEEGRDIIGQEKLDEHYKKVTRSVLQQVPFVHLGFSRSVAVVRKDKILVEEIILNRMIEGHLSVFHSK